MDDRKEFLLKMYDQLYNDINRHIIVVWQSVGTLIGAFAVFALVEKRIITLDIASSLIIMLAAWLLAHLYDAGYWYNRNLIMIANIERQFLKQSDLKYIHYYFGAHRPNNKMITHLNIQYALGIGIAILVIIWHFIERVLPGFGESWDNFNIQRALPYVVLIGAIIYLFKLRKNRNVSYEEFRTNSPGIDIDTEGIGYGEGHGH